MDYLSFLKHAITLLMLTYTSIHDMKTREVEPRLWVYFGLPLFIIYIFQVVVLDNVNLVLLKIQWIVNLLILSVLYLLYRIGLLGGGDVFALFIIGSTHYELGGYLYNNPPLPLLLQTIFFASMVSLIISAYYCISNIIYYRERLRQLKFNDALLYCFTAKSVRIRDIVDKRFWYPLERPWEGSRLRFFKVEEDDIELLTKLREWAIRTNSLDSMIWASYGIPFLLNILIGYVMALAGIGNLIIAFLLGH